MTETPAEPKRPLFGDNEVTRALKLAKGPFMFVFIANIATNILYMALPVFTTQVYGRVLQWSSMVFLGAVLIVLVHLSAWLSQSLGSWPLHLGSRSRWQA